MREEDKKLINTFETKLRHFMFLYDELKQENNELKQLLEQKNKELEVLKAEHNNLEIKYTNLRTARTISLYDKDIENAKQRLTGLVREVDRCIALLKE